MPFQQSCRGLAIPREDAHRLDGLGRTGVAILSEERHAAEQLARRDEAHERLVSVARRLRDLHASLEEDHEALRRVTLPEEEVARAEASTLRQLERILRVACR